MDLRGSQSGKIREYREKAPRMIKRKTAEIDDVIKGVSVNSLTKKSPEQVQI